MNNILLISEDTLKTYSNLNSNTFGKWILPAIREAQEMGLMPIIGECLYNKICELVADGSISDELFVAYKDLLDDKIQPYLIYKTLSNIIPILNAKLANIGSTLTNDEHIVNLTQGEADLLKTYYSERCDFYTKRLQDFIKNNASAFPEIACGCGNMQPNLDSSENSVGLWLGGSRGKRVGGESCACSSTGITCGDYQSGFTDGVEFQKRKLAITGFTENGRYIREDGYSEVVVDIAQTGHTDEELYEQYLSGYTNGLEEGYSEGYSSGSTDGYNSGYTSGETHQKSLLSALTITQNGNYNREDGYSAITVNVSGQSATLTTTAVTANGEYSAPQGYDGFSSFEVNVPQTGYTQQDLDNAYASGETHQKSLMTSTAVTENGVYTRSNGFSAVTVNVPQTGISGTNITVQSEVNIYKYGRYYFDYDYDTTVSSMTINFQPHHDYSQDYLTLYIISSGTINWITNGVTDLIGYSKDNGENWTNITSSEEGVSFNVNAGESVLLRGYRSNPQLTHRYYSSFRGSSAKFEVEGNIMSLIYSTGFTSATTIEVGGMLGGIFMDCTGLTSAENLVLPATTLSSGCYMSMFQGCTSLTTAPYILPATTLADYCYNDMFKGCTSLTTAPILPATDLSSLCYMGMFYNCTSLNYIKCLAVNYISGNNCQFWTKNVASSGTFIKNPNATAWKSGSDGIPTNWTVINNS